MSYFIDAHCHPVLKHYLFGEKYKHSLLTESNGCKDDNFTNRQVTIPAMKKAGVNAVLAAHYLPEKYILKDWKIAKDLISYLRIFIKRYIEKVESDDAYKQTLQMISDFENYIRLHPKDAVIAHSFMELKQFINEERRIFIHVLEGAHHLGRGKSIETYLKRIDELKNCGVALLTISHFFPNTISYPCEGISPVTKRALKVSYKLKESVSLKTIGIAVVNGMLDKGILLDLTHTNPTARAQIFALNRARGKEMMRPLIFSHVGVRHLFHDPDKKNKRFGNLCATDEEIMEINHCNGVIGIVFMNYWLTGIDERPGKKDESGFDFIVATIDHIRVVTNTFDNICIGTDFDGLNDPPDDYYDTAMLGKFRDRVVKENAIKGASSKDIENIFGGNILRVLEKGWT